MLGSVVTKLTMATEAPESTQVADITWTDTNAGMASHAIYRKVGTDGEPAKIATVPANVIGYTDPGPLEPGRTYCYVVRAVNAVGEAPRGPEDERCARAQGPPLPVTGVVVTIRQGPAMVRR